LRVEKKKEKKKGKEDVKKKEAIGNIKNNGRREVKSEVENKTQGSRGEKQILGAV